ncbi:MAG: glycosyltransferase family 2 protein [Lachnospiraceae bacterium]|nr:glycosyltransferase family 2 protein [Lachnospiraceae bacterium]
MVSVVLPAYNEADNIELAVSEISKTLSGTGEEYELVFISDGSSDGTYEKIQAASAADPHVKGAEFSRNFGKEAAIFAGLSLASGDAVIVMDCDLQHPVSVLPEMMEKWKAGAEVVEGIKNSRGREGIFHKLSAGLFYGIMSRLIKIDMSSSSDFKLLDRKAVDALLELPESNTFFRALTFWIGFRSEKVFYDVEERRNGSSKWTTKGLIKYAISNATSFSTLPLKLITTMGWIFIIFAVVLGIQTLFRYFGGTSADGFTTVILLLLIIGGFMMLSLGIAGHYIARIYEEVKGRPRFIIRDTTESLTGNLKGQWK